MKKVKNEKKKLLDLIYLSSQIYSGSLLLWLVGIVLFGVLFILMCMI